jgi:hypothetical protein
MKISITIDLDTDRKDALVIWSDTLPDSARDIKVLLEAVGLISSVMVKEEGKSKDQIIKESGAYLSKVIDDYIVKGEMESRKLELVEA